MYLSAHLRAVIEGSTVDQYTQRDILSMKLFAISKDIKKYLRMLKAQDFQNEYENFEKSSLKLEKSSLKLEKSSLKLEKFDVEEVKNIENIEIVPIKSKHNSVFSFSSPEIKPNNLNSAKLDINKEISLSSE